MPFLKTLLHFSKRQRNGLFVLLFLVFSLQLALYFDELFYRGAEIDHETELAYLEFVKRDSLARVMANTLPAAFPFNPNEANDSVYKALGLPYKLRAKVLNYLSRGGQFRVKRDLLKVYDMDTAWYTHVEGFILLPDTYSYLKNKQSNTKKQRFVPFDPNQVEVGQARELGLYDWQLKRLISYREKVKPFTVPEQLYAVYGFDSALVRDLLPYVQIDTALLTHPAKAEEKLETIDLAVADSAMLTRVRGLGGWTAKRIVEYREKLGGFVRKEQLLEVYGMKPERYATIKDQLTLGSTQVEKLNINTATFKELLRHPYLEYAVVKNIVNFREKTRLFARIEELQQIELVDGHLFAKIAPYLKVEQ